MDAKRILNYLKQLMANNNREWYWANKAEYDAIRADFEEGVKLAIGRMREGLHLPLQSRHAILE